MPNELENLEDLKSLLDREYALSIVNGYLIVNDVFYIGGDGGLQIGRLAAPLNLPSPNELGPPVNHQMYWSGSPPYYADGSEIPKLGAAQVGMTIGDTLYGQHLSNKPEEGFAKYSDMVEHYVALISGPATQKFGVSPLTGATYDVPPDMSAFKVHDTFSARAELTDLNSLIDQDQIAIIGLGGTGAFLLDFLVKTPVRSITAYDFDTFKVHNAFRSPGEVPIQQFGHLKTSVYERKYTSFRHRMTFNARRVGEEDDALFRETTFAFVCIDDGEARSEICALLLRIDIPFIDCGMGVEKENGALDGLLRTTMFTSESAEFSLGRVPLDSQPVGIYRTLVQTAELNALNAALAILRYKQHRGFYADDEKYAETIMSIGSSNIIGVRCPTN